MNIKLISKLVFLLSFSIALSACGTGGKKPPVNVVFSNNMAEVEAGASLTPRDLIDRQDLRQVRFATCVAEQLSLTKGGARMVQGFFNNVQAGNREAQYVNGVSDWKENLKIGGALGFLQYALERKAENGRVAQNVTLAESNCGRMLSSVVKFETDAIAGYQAKLNSDINNYNTLNQISREGAAYLCQNGHQKYCGSK